MTLGRRVAEGARDGRVVALGGVLIVALGLIVVLVCNGLAVRELAGRGADLERRRATLLAGDPVPTGETTRRLNLLLEEARNSADALETRLFGRGRMEGSDPRDDSARERADAFFDLAWYTEEMRATAAAANVELLPREAFGFAAHAEGAPRSEDVPRVHRQRERIERLLRLLFAAGPARLDSVRRERPPEDRSLPRERAEDSGAERDYFEPESHLLIRRSVKVDTLAFRLCFVATGAGVLRTLINGLLADETGWMVRWVEVNPVEDAAVAARDMLVARPLRVSLLIESLEGSARAGLTEEPS